MGEAVMERTYDHERGVYCCRLVRSDPRVWCTAELMEKAMDGELPHIRVTGEQLDVVTVTDDYGKRVIYRLVEFDPVRDAWILEWPD